RIATVVAADLAALGELRAVLWPDETAAQHALEAAAALGQPRMIAFIATDDSGAAIGFAEATIRVDSVNGALPSPVGFREGWYVAPAWRRRGVGRALVALVEQWTRAQGCSELASDALLDNDTSHRAHAACGFAETERVVYFRKTV